MNRRILLSIFKSLCFFVLTVGLAAQGQAQLKTYQFTGTSTSGNAGSTISGAITLDLLAAPDECHLTDDSNTADWYTGDFAIDAITDTGVAVGTNVTGGRTEFFSTEEYVEDFSENWIFNFYTDVNVRYDVLFWSYGDTTGDGVACNVPDPWDPFANDNQVIQIRCINRITGEVVSGEFQLDTFSIVDPVVSITGEIIAQVQDLNDEGWLGNGQANPINNQLEQAIQEYNKGKTAHAVQKLEQARAEIQDLIDDGDLDPEVEQKLQDLIEDIDVVLTEILSGSN